MNELEVVNIRLLREPPLYCDKPIRKPGDAVEVVGKEISQYDREVFCVLNLKANGQIINMNIVCMGTLDQAIVSPREVFKSSILSNARSIILMHNHPSGSLNPSNEDKRITRRLWECGRLLGIDIADHIIIAGTSGEMFSFKERGYLQEMESSEVAEAELIPFHRRKEREER